MSADGFEDFLKRAADGYHRPPETPREEMWVRIVARRAEAGRGGQKGQVGQRAQQVRWMRWGLAAAAVLAVGIGIGLAIGRSGVPGATPAVAPLAVERGVPSAQLPAAFAIATYDHLRRVETFLEVFQAEARSARVPPETPDVARGLLENTRLLMDSPVGRNQRVAVLLDDVEVVLAQIASYEGSRDHGDLQLIEQGIEQRGLLAKLRAAAPATYQVARAQGVL
jgi:hypothetical protein